MCFFNTLSTILKACRLIRFHMNVYANDEHGDPLVNRFAARHWLKSALFDSTSDALIQSLGLRGDIFRTQK